MGFDFYGGAGGGSGFVFSGANGAGSGVAVGPQYALSQPGMGNGVNGGEGAVMVRALLRIVESKCSVVPLRAGLVFVVLLLCGGQLQVLFRLRPEIIRSP
jgi:hypothetical protein